MIELEGRHYYAWIAYEEHRILFMRTLSEKRSRLRHTYLLVDLDGFLFITIGVKHSSPTLTFPETVKERARYFPR